MPTAFKSFFAQLNALLFCGYAFKFSLVYITKQLFLITTSKNRNRLKQQFILKKTVFKLHLANFALYYLIFPINKRF